MLGNSDILLKKALVALVLSATNDGINGRKKLQKIVYLANNSGWDVINDFRFHLYGPYSEHLLTEIQNLQRLNVVQVQAVRYYGDNPFYLHRITEEGRTLLEGLETQLHDQSVIARTINLVRELNEYTADQLELMASLYYLKHEYPALNDDELIEELATLKQQFSEDQIREALIVFEIMERNNPNMPGRIELGN
jgi:uncharacterized protein YwgA